MKNNIRKVLSVVLGCFSLVGCSSIEKPNIPQDYADQLASIEGGTVENVNFNTKDQYYTNFTDANDTALNNLLLTVAQKASNGEIKDRKDESKVLKLNSSVANDSTAGSIKTYYATTTDQKSTMTFKGIGEELKTRGEKTLKEKVTGGSYNKDNRFDENKLIREIEKDQLTDLKAKNGGDIAQTTLNYNEMKVVNANMSFDEIFSAPDGQAKKGSADYTEYIQDSLYPDIIRNKLTAQYIYNEKFGNIALANMQKLNVLTITDRTDITGAARKFINAYYNHYVESGAVDPSYEGKPLEEMERLWNGIGAFDDEDKKNAIYTTDGKALLEDGSNKDKKLYFYGWNDQYENYLSNTQKQWLADNKIDTLFDQIVDNYYKAKIKKDQTQYNDFSSSKTQDIEIGLISKVDSLLKNDIRKEGIYSKSSLSSVDSSVTDRVFTQYSNEDELMKDFTGKSTLAESKLKFYFPTVSESSVSAPVFYNSGTYTFVQMEYNYNNANLGSSKTANEGKGSEAVANAMDAAYEMISDGNYKTDGIVYWLKNLAGKDNSFVVNNQSFYDYLKTSYPDLFDDDK